MSDRVDLNTLLAHFRQVEREFENGGSIPMDQATGVFVDCDARIQLGSPNSHGELSRVPVRAAAISGDEVSEFDLVTNRRVAATKMPPTAIEVTGQAAGPMGVGWAFTVTTELADSYTILIAYDGQYCQGYDLEPELERHYKDLHRYHLFSGARIDFGGEHHRGMPTLQEAYAKSVV